MSSNAFGAIERDQIRNDALRDQEKTERAAAAARPVIIDADRVKWMAERIDYLEHRNRDGVKCAQVKTGQYWPQCEDESPADPDMVDLTLIEYIDAQIRLDRMHTECLCWNCNKAYPIDAPICPTCWSINANVDLAGAQKQMEESA